MSAPSVKQHLAAIRMLFDWLILGQIIPMNPAAAVRGPKHVYVKSPVQNRAAGSLGTLRGACPLTA